MTNFSNLDAFDRAILRELVADARLTQGELAARVHLSNTAVARRQRQMEERHIIEGYHAEIAWSALGLDVAVTVLITLSTQRDDAFNEFERRIAKCPSVLSCHLLSGSEDYLVTLRACNLADFERIHREELSTLPAIAQMRSLFTLREVISRKAPVALIDGIS